MDRQMQTVCVWSDHFPEVDWDPMHLAVCGDLLYACDGNSLSSFRIHDDATISHSETRALMSASGSFDVIVAAHNRVYICVGARVYVYGGLGD